MEPPKNTTDETDKKTGVKRIAVIGAGVSGLCCARRFTESHVKDKFEVIVYEQTNRIGGTWVYTPKVGVDTDTGLPVHASMYESLRTNLPKECMEFPDFHYGSHLRHQSYISWSEVLKYLEEYTDHFHLRELIHFEHVVISISRSQENEWKVRLKDLRIDASFEETFDYVMVCNGHNSVPNMPSIKGSNLFKGQQMHSHDYRVPEPFRNKNVLVMGFGPSGVDIAMEIEKVAKHVILSHHIGVAFKHQIGDKIEQKPDIKEILEDGVVFQDDTALAIDSILYCTGYMFEYPFLTPSCDIIVEEHRFVHPLFKHTISIQHPSMAFIGLPYLAFTIPLFDLQVNFYLKYILNEIELPSKEEMINEYEKEINEKAKKGLKRKHFHILGEGLMERYINDIKEYTGGALSIPKSVIDVYKHSGMERKKFNFKKYRNLVYTIIDDNTFEVYEKEETAL